MGFSEKDLVDYISTEIVPKEAMMQLNTLLFKELREYCIACEDDRMICVLSPMCPKRILLKVRFEANAGFEDLPKFCYSQAVNNIRRYLNKNTTLYTPQDELIYNKDFIDIMFPRQYKNIIENYNKDLGKLHEILGKSKVPAVHLDFHHGDRQIFDKIFQKDKLIREGTFIYDFFGQFLLTWFDSAIFISDFKTDMTIVNAKEDIIKDLQIIDLVFHVYSAEQNIDGFTTLSSKNQISLIMKIPYDQVHVMHFQEDSSYFGDLIEILQNYFFEIEISMDSQNFLVISLVYQNLGHFLKQNQLDSLTYDKIHQLLKRVNGLRVLKTP
ncbi:MAG: hypothetical protein E4G98_02730 [Promethearchaeota archaeon]|nr:MAG: hypothetical protein E4G98_02730 [Candidatus Lokiarchaeota archaeon]